MFSGIPCYIRDGHRAAQVVPDRNTAGKQLLKTLDDACKGISCLTCSYRYRPGKIVIQLPEFTPHIIGLNTDHPAIRIGCHLIVKPVSCALHPERACTLRFTDYMRLMSSPRTVCPVHI